MSKLGKRLIAAAKRHRETVVTKSCGCVFCDIGLAPTSGMHDVPSEGIAVPCGLAANDNWKCPIRLAGCASNCGNYGCGN
jgi:hypothetical protein